MDSIIFFLVLCASYILGNIFIYLIKKPSKSGAFLGALLYLLIALGVISIIFRVNNIV